MLVAQTVSLRYFRQCLSGKTTQTDSLRYLYSISPLLPNTSVKSSNEIIKPPAANQGCGVGILSFNDEGNKKESIHPDRPSDVRCPNPFERGNDCYFSGALGLL
jgi:hypothetical protein